MFTIGQNFHVIHMSDDIAALDAWYDDVFDVSRWISHSVSEDLRRIASLVGIGKLCIEPMQPTFDIDGWEKVPLGRFFTRYGRQWHSIAWFVDDADGLTELRDRLENAGVELLGLLGGKLEHAGEEPEDRPIFTHPKSTLTQLEFMVPIPDIPDPRLHQSYRATWWHDTHPLHIRKHSHFTLATRDLEHAREMYVDVIGGTVLHEGQNDLLKSRSIYVAVGRDDVVELAEPLEAGTPIADYLDENHHGLFAVSLQVEDLADATRYLKSKDIEARVEDASTFVSDPATTQGVHWGFTTAEIPNDSRADW